MKLPLALLALAAVCLHAQDSTYQNPVEGISYTAKWKSYSPANGSTAKTIGPITVKSIRLLSTQAEFADNISANELSEFIKATQNNIAKSVGQPTDSYELLIDTILTKNKEPRFEIASKGKVSDEQLQKIYDGLKEMTGFKSKSAELKYEIYLEINPTAKPDQPPRPKEDR